MRYLHHASTAHQLANFWLQLVPDSFDGINECRAQVVWVCNQNGYTEIAKYKVADTPVYAHPVVAGNRVFVEDQDSVTLWTVE